MITLPISDTTFSYIIFDFLEDILHPFSQVFNLGRRISQKHNNKETNWKTTLQTATDNFMITSNSSN